MTIHLQALVLYWALVLFFQAHNNAWLTMVTHGQPSHIVTVDSSAAARFMSDSRC